MPLIVKVAVPVFFSVTTCAALAVPTVWLPKLKEVGERLTAGVPVPDDTPLPLRLTFCGLPVALSLTVTVPVRVPVVVGLKFTLIVQLVRAASDVPQVPSPARVKSPLTVMLLIVKVAVPVLVSVENCAMLVIPTV